MPRIAAVLVALALLAGLAYFSRSSIGDFRNGIVRRRYRIFNRNAEPKSFWFWTILNGVTLAIVLALAVAALLSVIAPLFL